MTETGKGSGFAHCARCGRANPSELRFCQDCGNRLEGHPPSLKAGTAQILAPAPPRPPGGSSCRNCGMNNPDPGRFCVHCGAVLAVADGARAPTQQTAVVAPAPLAPTSQAARRDGPAPTGSQARGAEPNERGYASTIPCPRCQGANAPHLTFCQFYKTHLAIADSPMATLASSGMQPNSADRARLVIIAQDGTPGRQYPLAEDQVDIGREEGAILLPSDPYVSQRHARILRRNQRFFVRDLASVNGVYVRIRNAERLQHADLVLIGLEVLRFEVVSDAEKGLGPATERGTRVFGSPALPRYARLCQRTVEGATRDVFYLGRDETTIGRESGDLVFTNDPFMSRRHAVFTRDPATQTFVLQDLGSSNGTYLAIRGEHELEPGDHIRVGQHLFRLDVETGRPRS